MRDHKPESTSELISSINEHVRSKASFLAKINQEIHQILPHTKAICRVANFREGVLILECASSAWIMRLNYERLLLLSTLRKALLPTLTTIEIKINPDLAKAEIERYRKLVPSKSPISQQSADSLDCLAETSSEKIAKRLRSISKLAR